MRRALLWLTLAALLGGCGQDDPPERTPRVLTVVQDDAELLHRSDARVAATLDDLRDVGVDWVRVTAGWSAVAPADGPPPDPADPAGYGQAAWSRLDRVARLARERGLRLNVDIAFWAPRWAVSRQLEGSQRQRVGVDVAAFADFAEAVARRYGDAAAFTIWNEPNHPTFLLPQWERRDGAWVPASPHHYRAMLEAAVPRVRRHAPDALVLIGGLSSLGAVDADAADDRMAPLLFVRQLACVDDRLRPLDRPECRDAPPLPGDGFAHHPYTSDRWPTEPSDAPGEARVAEVDRLAQLLERLHAAGRTERALPIYVTEYGVQTDPPDPTARWSPDEQARILPAAEEVLRSVPAVRSTAQFLVRDLPARPGDTLRERWRDFQTGLRYVDGRPKPAHAAYAVGLVARRAGSRRVEFWGVVRPGSGPYQARIRVREGGAWRTLLSPGTDREGLLQASAEVDPQASFRLEARIDDRWRAGATLRGATDR